MPAALVSNDQIPIIAGWLSLEELTALRLVRQQPSHRLRHIGGAGITPIRRRGIDPSKDGSPPGRLVSQLNFAPEGLWGQT
jgi:hypothetical protein